MCMVYKTLLYSKILWYLSYILLFCDVCLIICYVCSISCVAYAISVDLILWCIFNAVWSYMYIPYQDLEYTSQDYQIRITRILVCITWFWIDIIYITIHWVLIYMTKFSNIASHEFFNWIFYRDLPTKTACCQLKSLRMQQMHLVVTRLL
jgi:hypothetical protein